MKNPFRHLIKKIRRFFVVAFARRNYDKSAKLANELCRQNKCHYYVVIDPFFGKSLMVLFRGEFRAIKRKYNDSMIHSFVRTGRLFLNKSTMYDVQDGCFYSTLLDDADEIEMRRQAYIEWVVELSEKKNGKA